MLIDADERPDLATALMAGEINQVTCPHCEAKHISNTPLLYHDRSQRKLYFAAPLNTAEHIIREQAQGLLYTLAAHIPEEERLTYLGDVQVEQGLAGVQRVLKRRQRARERLQANKGTSAPEITREPVREPSASATPLVDEPSRVPAARMTPAEAQVNNEQLIELIHQLLMADSLESFRSLLERYPQLRSSTALTVLDQAIDMAGALGDQEITSALRQLRSQLTKPLSELSMPSVPAQAEEAPPQSEPEEPPPPPEPPAKARSRVPKAEPSLPTTLTMHDYQALMNAQSVEDLRASLGEQPALLEPWANEDLDKRIEQTLDAGNEQLAFALEARREALAELRQELAKPETLVTAIKAVLAAKNEDALADILRQYPILLTTVAQSSLVHITKQAKEQGNSKVAQRAEQRRRMLYSVRVGLYS